MNKESQEEILPMGDGVLKDLLTSEIFRWTNYHKSQN